MAIDLSGLIEQGIVNMKEEQTQQLQNEATVYLEKIEVILSKIQFLENSTTLADFNRVYGNSNMVNATKILENDSDKVAKNKLLLEGYHILSEVGAWVGNRESTNYTVVVSGNLEGVNQKYSWNELTFEQFAEMVDFSGVGPYGYSGKKLVLKDSATLLSQFSDSASGWKERTQAYEKFDEAVRRLTTDGYGHTLTWKKRKNSKKQREYKWQNVTKGNTLEAFLRYEKLLENASLTEEQRLYIAMNETMSKPAPFYQGGDIGRTQIKGDYATVAQNQTIINHLRSTSGMLKRLISNLKSSLKNKDSPVSSDISANITKSIETEIEKLMKEFISGIVR